MLECVINSRRYNILRVLSYITILATTSSGSRLEILFLKFYKIPTNKIAGSSDDVSKAKEANGKNRMTIFDIVPQ